jgi:class 3 adenylate cyclase
VTIGSLVATGAVALQAGERGTDQAVEERLNSVRTTRTLQLARYLERTQAQVAALASTDQAATAVARFASAYRQLEGDGRLADADEEVLERFYTGTYLPELARISGNELGLDAALPQTRAGAYLQRYYVAEPSTVTPDLKDDAGDGSQWSEAHADIHPALREITDQLGYGDLYLIEPEQLAIVYSTRKAPDFATRLDLGPYSGSALAAVVTEVLRDPQVGGAVVTDLRSYPPAENHAEQFFASAIHSGTELVGVLAARGPVDRIDQIMTGDGDWRGEGLGDSGEAYAVGPDRRMRSISRAFVADGQAYVRDAAAAGTLDTEQRQLIEVSGTTALAQAIPLSSVSAGAVPVSATSYHGTQVLSTSQALDVPGLDWVVVTEIGRDEVFAARQDYRQQLMIGVALLVIAVTFFAVVWANHTVGPLRMLSAAVDRLRGDASWMSDATIDVPARSPREFSALGERVTTMARSLHAGEEKVRAATQQRLELLRSLLPPQIAHRVEAGDRAVIDQAPAASVVVLILSGLGELARSSRTDGHRELVDQEIGALDTLAAQHGLERVKLAGDAYFAACGLDRLYLDHPVRALTFAVEARNAVHAVAAEAAVNLDLAAGVANGPVMVGLAGASRLMYDIWGETVSTAQYLARTARPGQVLVTGTVAEVHLPADLVATPVSESVWEVSSP